MYKFYGEKEKAVKNGLGTIVFRFDTKGEFITDDLSFIERIKPHFDYVEMEGKEIGQRVKVEVKIPIVTITNNLEPKSDEIENKRHCKKCDFKCDTQGELLTHYREKHPKEG